MDVDRKAFAKEHGPRNGVCQGLNQRPYVKLGGGRKT